jgi:hypothetical protein
MFAEGIPKRISHRLSKKDKDAMWTLAIQEHDARKAGKHWDLRLVDPVTHRAHSWAIPKAQLPDGDKPLLAVRTPTHTEHYALNFGAKGPQQIGKGYGMGSVVMKHKEPVKIDDVGKNKINFSRSDGSSYSLFKTKGESWLLRKRKQQMNKKAFLTQYMRLTALEKLSTALRTIQDKPETDKYEPADFVEERHMIEDQNTPAGALSEVLRSIPDLEVPNSLDKEENYEGYDSPGVWEEE